MKTYIILINLNYSNEARRICETLENQVFKSIEDLPTLPENSLLYEITDFMDAVNDQELDILTDYYISYVKCQ